jgi:hypothetical protein
MPRTLKSIVSLVAVLLLTLALTGAAHARPNWVGITAKVSMMKTGKNINAAGYWTARVTVTYKNNSRDKIITVIFNKTGTITIQDSGGQGYIVDTNSSKANKMELYPGQSTKLHYDRQITRLSSPYPGATWKDINSRFLKMKVKIVRWSHDFQVRSKNL